MRWLLATLLILAPAQAIVLEDATGDVVADHCKQAETPVAGFEAMDLVSLAINETPTDVAFSVVAAGLESEADYDAGNYFVYVSRLDTHYTIRLLQDNTGSGALAEIYRVPTPGNPFGDLLGEVPAHIDGPAGSITATVPRDYLVDSDGSTPVRGQQMSGIVVSAEAHATGAYWCAFDGGSGGPYIVEDQMPDGLDLEAAAEHTFVYGGGTSNGPIAMDIERPFRASNGEATRYAFRVMVTNEADVRHEYTVDPVDMPDDWVLIRPKGMLGLDGGASGVFTVYLTVPFQHQHGTTVSFDLQVRSVTDPLVQARSELGVHYLTTAQPSGHHPSVWLHTSQSIGLPIASHSGAGANHMFWNTLEEDERDQAVPVTAQTMFDDAAYAWYGCLHPRLAMGISPGNGTGAFEFQFSQDVPQGGTLSGEIHHILPEDREAMCTYADTWSMSASTEVMLLEPTPWTGGSVDGIIQLSAQDDIPFVAGSDLLLILRFHPDTALTPQTAPQLLGGRMDLPLEDYHEPFDAAVEGNTSEEAPFTPPPVPVQKDSPALAPIVMLAGLLLLARRR